MADARPACIVCGDGVPKSPAALRCGACRTRRRRPWTAKEDALVRRVYADAWILGCTDALAVYLRRSRAAVTVRAGKLGVTKRAGSRGRAAKCGVCSSPMRHPRILIRDGALYMLCRECMARLEEGAA